MDNLLGLGAKAVCGFFPRKSKMTSKRPSKRQFSDKMQILLSWFTQK